MRRRVAVRWLGVLLLGAGRAVVAGESPPPLSGPALTATPGSPAPGSEPGGLPALAPETGPILVIPGVNAPGRVRARSAPLPPLEPAGTSSGDDGPQLFGPSSLGPAASAPALKPSFSSPSRTTARPSGIQERPLPRESIPEPTAVSGPAARASSSPVDPAATPESRSAPTVPRRPPGLFGRFLPSPFSSGRGGDPSAITVEPSTDPASEAALKRRIERQIHESLGDRVHDVDVRVVGPEVTIRARATRFWQRRTVRRTLESLPGLAGYRPAVEMLD